MSSVTFTLEMMDTQDVALQIDLEQFSDYIEENGLSFKDEFLASVWNYMVHAETDGFSQDYDPQVHRIILDVEDMSSYIDIHLNHVESDGGWSNLASQLEALCDYGREIDWFNDYSDRFKGILAYISDETWAWANVTKDGIENAMAGYRGIPDDVWDVVNDLMEDWTLEPIPDWVSVNKDRTIRELEAMGHITTRDYGWYTAVWS